MPPTTIPSFFRLTAPVDLTATASGLKKVRRFEMVASPLLIDGERLPIRRPPPTLGQHTDETYDDWS